MSQDPPRTAVHASPGCHTDMPLPYLVPARQSHGMSHMLAHPRDRDLQKRHSKERTTPKPSSSSDQASQIWIFTRRSDSKGLGVSRGSSATPPRREQRPNAPPSSAPTKVGQGLHPERRDHHSRFQASHATYQPENLADPPPCLQRPPCDAHQEQMSSHLPGHRGRSSSANHRPKERTYAARKGK